MKDPYGTRHDALNRPPSGGGTGVIGAIVGLIIIMLFAWLAWDYFGTARTPVADAPATQAAPATPAQTPTAPAPKP